jgi:thiamine biosynthesis lipoprotein
MDCVTLSLPAMATRFELALYGDDAARLRAAGEEALREIERIEAQLSFYLTDSELRWLNTHAARRPVRVEPRLFSLLQDCATLTAQTDGAFDVTIGPLMRAWHFTDGHGAIPSAEQIASARAITGMRHVCFNDDDCAISFSQPGVEIDLGGYGKGYAIERAIALLRENGITSALLHGGTSSVATIGAPPESDAWRIALQAPLNSMVGLRDQSLSVSAVHGKSFAIDGRKYGHVIDPRSGEPVSAAAAAAAIGPSASVCEALSKALLVVGPDWLPVMHERFPDYQGLTA